MKKIAVPAIMAGLLVFCQACGDPEGPDYPDSVPVINNAVIDPAVTYQEMIGFGGSLTWYSERVTASPQKEQICRLLFEDLGTDIIRFKNNYYPLGYPAVKSPATMENSSIKTLWNVTGDLYASAKQLNPGIQILVSSWTPPSALKSNNNLREGTLKKENGAFMYEAFGDYWNDLLDNLQFNPDYISIQNEPGWITPDWETCEWRPTETAEFPGYDAAFDAVYSKIGARTNPPEMIGPEAENIGYSGKLGGNTFAVFSDPVKNKPHLAAYAYHTYNYSASTLIAQTKTDLNMIRNTYGNKPCIMTEYSNFTWLNTAWFIIQNINEANAAGYIYWLMAWADSNNDSMIKLSSTGAYTLTPFYYVMKHFSKEIDKGYVRVSVLSPSIPMSGFIDPAGKKIVIVAVNPNDVATNYTFPVTGKTVKTIRAAQTDEVSNYKDIQPVGTDKYIILKPKSVTTVVLELL
jgi:glucuronoarabinoxylan endo-1,4-beta-xylanase